MQTQVLALGQECVQNVQFSSGIRLRKMIGTVIEWREHSPPKAGWIENKINSMTTQQNIIYSLRAPGHHLVVLVDAEAGGDRRVVGCGLAWNWSMKENMV